MIRTGVEKPKIYHDHHIEPGEKLTVRSIDWYNRNKDKYGKIRNPNGFDFDKGNSKYCGCTVTVSYKDELASHGGLRIKEDGWAMLWYRWMFEEFEDELPE